MILNRVDAKDIAGNEATIISLSNLGIDASHLEAIQKVCEELKHQGIYIKAVK